jgi:hypothetical protein
MGENEVRQIQDFIARRDCVVREAIVWFLRDHDKSYSRELRDKLGLDIPIARIQKILRQLEGDGVLTSCIETPPFNDGPRCFMARRYYKKVVRS